MGMAVSLDNPLMVLNRVGPQQAFCLRHAILAEAQQAVDVAQQSFPAANCITLRLEQDPECDEEWLDIHITVQDEIDRFLASFEQCKNQWVAKIPWQALRFIRLSYTLS
jgi:hypothetical protein